MIVFKFQLWQQTLLGMFLGIIFGLYATQYVCYIKPIGDVFMRMIKMGIPALIFFTLVSGITNSSSSDSIKGITLKLVLYFLIANIYAPMFGILIAVLLKPGSNVAAESEIGNVLKEFNFMDFVLDIVPNNIFEAFVSGNFLQIVFFSVIVGITLNISGNKLNNMKHALRVGAQMMLQMISMIMYLAPVGVFAICAYVVSSQGLGVIIGLSKLIVVVIFALFCQYLICGIFIFCVGKVSPLPFYKKSIGYQLFAISTCSSKATLVPAMETCRKDLGMSELMTSIAMPLGASLNMIGSATKLGLITVFFTQIYGLHLTCYEYFVITVMSAICAVSGAGIPGGALVMLPMVMSSVHLPVEGAAMVAGIDRILDMFVTVMNISGDVAVALVSDSRNGSLDRGVYYSYK